ncbi:MAG TPA: winged helix-turn-helix transcriptional regulator [Clostridiales bacterium]|nr:winged helix-turn-helix transcriptional regulator [Clostridiales bacterium]
MEHNYQKFNDTAELLKTLAHPVRICIVSGLLKKGECNVSYMQNCLAAPQSTISQHIQKLKAAGIIEGRRQGLEIYYRVTDERVAALMETLLSDK